MLFLKTYIAMETITLLKFELPLLSVYECILMYKYMLTYLAQPENIVVVLYFHFLT